MLIDNLRWKIMEIVNKIIIVCIQRIQSWNKQFERNLLIRSDVIGKGTL